MRFDTILVDLDGTVLDFAANERQALDRLFASRGIVLTPEIREHYCATNVEFWRRYERGEISVKQLCDTRFTTVLARFGYQVDGADWEREYRCYLGDGHAVMPHAREVCGVLSREGRLYVATNGVRRTQLKRLRESGLLPLFRDIFDSETIGTQKPFAGFFDYVKSHIPEFDPQRTLMVGDSPASDILGGRTAGLHTCLYDPEGRGCGGEEPAEFTISDLRQLIPLCRG